MPNLSLLQQLTAHRARARHLRWISGGASALVAASMLLPQLFPQSALSSWLRVIIAIASGAVVVGAVLAARAIQSHLAEFEWAMGELAERARDLKARAGSDPTARAEYVAYLRDSRDELRNMPERLGRHGSVTETQLLPALDAIDAEIALYDTALAPGSWPPQLHASRQVPQNPPRS